MIHRLRFPLLTALLAVLLATSSGGCIGRKKTLKYPSNDDLWSEDAQPSAPWSLSPRAVAGDPLRIDD